MRRHVAIFVMILSVAPGLLAGDAQVRHVAEPVPGLYLVQLRDTPPSQVRAVAQDALAKVGGHLRLAFTHATTGFSAAMSEQQATALAINAVVDFVEEVAVGHLSAEQPLPTDNSLWQLDRLDQTDNVFDHKYDYCERGGSVTAYVIGTGVYKNHVELQGINGSRVVRGAKYADDDSVAPGDTVDYGYWPCAAEAQSGSPFYGDPYFSGHDTAVASVLAGQTVGVAKAVTIVPIRVLNCNGQTQTERMSWAIDWIMDRNQNPYYTRRPAVVSMSAFAFTQSCVPPNPPNPDPVAQATSFLENEVNKLVGHPYINGACTTPGPSDWSGVPMVVSANNQNSSQSNTSPARMAYTNTSFNTCGHVISVGGIDETDNRWVCNPAVEQCDNYPTYCGEVTNNNPPTGSNYGPTVDIFAPAHNLTIAGVASPTADETRYVLRSGTSYAAPIVAGIVARLQQRLGTLSADDAWYQVSYNASLAPAALDPVTGNRMIAHLSGAQQCFPEYP